MRGVLLSVAFAVALVLSGCASKPSSESEGAGTTTSSADGDQASGDGATVGPSGSTTSANVVAGGTGNRAPVLTSFRTNLTAANVTTGAAPLKVTFTFNATDADKDNLTYTLTFGVAKANATGKLGKLGGNATYTYTAAGNYSAKLTISDSKSAVNRTVKIAVSAASSVPAAIDHRECTGSIGTNPVGVSYNGPGGPFGGCSFGAAVETDVKVAALTGTDGCAHDASPTGASNAYGTDVTVGSTFPAGAVFRLICDVGVIEFEGTLDLLAI